MTLRVPTLSDAVAAYHALGYQDASCSPDSAAAIALTDPMLKTCPSHTILMSQEPYQTLTLVEWDGDIPTPFAAPGWAAMEVLVKDLDALFADLPPAFSLLNPPAALSFSEQIRAMQVAGPAGELIYFTEVSGEVPGFSLPTATQQVNQCFVMINAVTAIQTSIDFYARLFNCAAPSAMPARVSILSRSNGLDEDHRHAIAPIRSARDNSLNSINGSHGPLSQINQHRVDGIRCPSGATAPPQREWHRRLPSSLNTCIATTSQRQMASVSRGFAPTLERRPCITLCYLSTY